MLQDFVYKSILYHAITVAPSGVAVVEGESYGIRYNDPRIVAPSITVTIADVESSAIELGSNSLQYQVIYTLTGKSRLQRDALKDSMYRGVTEVPVRIYNSFTQGFVPTESATVIRTAQLGDYVKIVDTPRFETGNELLFWVSVLYAQLFVV